mmetsp:Transcript_85685/g.222852  ORF Transcript_85685/g.222852 Transcript_85685/m.222852 type:complete len:123 (+) Transcript_85685:386-754(+)
MDCWDSRCFKLARSCSAVGCLPPNVGSLKRARHLLLFAVFDCSGSGGVTQGAASGAVGPPLPPAQWHPQQLQQPPPALSWKAFEGPGAECRGTTDEAEEPMVELKPKGRDETTSSKAKEITA